MQFQHARSAGTHSVKFGQRSLPIGGMHRTDRIPDSLLVVSDQNAIVELSGKGHVAGGRHHQSPRSSNARSLRLASVVGRRVVPGDHLLLGRNEGVRVDVNNRYVFRHDVLLDRARRRQAPFVPPAAGAHMPGGTRYPRFRSIVPLLVSSQHIRPPRVAGLTAVFYAHARPASRRHACDGYQAYSEPGRLPVFQRVYSWWVLFRRLLPGVAGNRPPGTFEPDSPAAHASV